MFSIKTPAKINTFLNIDSVREDGYHNLFSHMQLIDLFDEISFVPSNSNVVFCEYSELQEQNLIIKSIEYFNETFSTNFNFQINLKKNIHLLVDLVGEVQMQPTQFFCSVCFQRYPLKN